MPIPSLESLSPLLDRLTMDALGDTVRYKPAAGAWGDRKADVDYRDAVKGFERAEIIEQNITVRLLKVDVPAKPATGALVQFPRFPGLTFKPLNARSTESGAEWEFEVTQVPGG